MSKAFKSILLFLEFSIIFHAVGYAAHQVEEGWRWKKNLDVYVTTRVAGDAAADGEEAEAVHYGPVPVQQIHTEMVEHETMLTHN